MPTALDQFSATFEKGVGTTIQVDSLMGATVFEGTDPAMYSNHEDGATVRQCRAEVAGGIEL